MLVHGGPSLPPQKVPSLLLGAASEANSPFYGRRAGGAVAPGDLLGALGTFLPNTVDLSSS